ncbi:hypothetical protein [Burkholderia phage FLC9]|nr:hypothetical protein [Burkholderia phage FLC9]
MSQKAVAVVYAELDALLDTRAGTLARLSQEIAAEVLRGNYHKRDSDQFAGVDMKAYRDLYAKRNVETLQASRPTKALLLLGALVRYLKEQATVRPYHETTKVVINTFPYTLDREEEAELGTVIATWISGLAPVELVHMRPQELTPLFIKQQSYSSMLMYEYDEWMSLHYAADNKFAKPIQDVSIFAPAIYFADKPSDEQIQHAIDVAAHPLQAVEILARSLVGLNLIDVEYFSIIRPSGPTQGPVH